MLNHVLVVFDVFVAIVPNLLQLKVKLTFMFLIFAQNFENVTIL